MFHNKFPLSGWPIWRPQVTSHSINPFPDSWVPQVLHFWFYNASGFTREQIFGYEVLRLLLTDISSLALEAITCSQCKTQAPSQRRFFCSLMINKASHCLFCSPGDQILTVLTYPCLQRSLLCIHSTELSTCPHSALSLHVWGTGWLSPWDLIHCSFVHSCCRGNWVFLVQIQGFEMQSRQKSTALNGHSRIALCRHSSSILPPREDGNLTLIAAVPVWAHLLHKSPLFYLLYVLTLCKCPHVFPPRSSLCVGSSLTLPSNSCEQPLPDRF